MSFDAIITDAGRRSLTVQLKVELRRGEIEVIEVEPYGRKAQGDSNLLFCLDVNTYEYKNIDMAKIRNVETTRRMFKPRFPVDF